MKNPKSVIEPIIATSVVLFVFLCLLVGFSLYWNITNLYQEIIHLATIEAKATWNKDQAFRSWATKHGGLYVKPDKRTPPNPYLSHLPQRDVITKDDVKLTLMNPAYMMSQMTKEYEESYGVKGNITGKILLNPKNKPDEWELKALNKFDQGIEEVIEQETINGQSYIRLMRPMRMKQGCVKCHGHLGFKVGDIRGGVSVSIPLGPYFSMAEKTANSIKFTHGAVWLLGVLFILAYTWVAHRRESARMQLQEHIRNQNINLSEARDSAEKASRAKSEFLSRMSHELRTPMNAILGFAQIFESDSSLSNEHKDNVNEILGAGYHLLNLINEVLDLSTIESGNMEITITDLNLNDVLHQCTEMVSEKIRERHIALINNISSSSRRYTVKADSVRLVQVLLNLLSNAVKYNRDHGRITLDANLTNNKYLRICVTDTGEGIEQDDIVKLFAPFERLNMKSNIEGTGIGLVITKHLIELMDGAIGVECSKGEGCTFWVEIPLA